MNPLEFDPLSPAFASDPYPFYARLRAAREPVWFQSLGMWMVSRFDEVSAIATHPKAVRSLVGHVSGEELARQQRAANWHNMPYHERVVQFSLLDSDGDTHRRLRNLVFGALTNASVLHMENTVRSVIRERLDALPVERPFDFIRDFAEPLPGTLIGDFLGIPEDHHDAMRVWSEHVVRYFDVDRTDAKKHSAETATREFHHFLDALINKRKAQPQDDLLSKMVAQEGAGYRNRDELISTAMLILMAGHGSSLDVMGSAMNLLARRPDVWKRLRTAPELLPIAILEVFRYEPPLPFFHRHMLEDVEIGGKVFPKGTTFGLLYGAANRDADAFDDPDTFDITRSSNRHLAFGRGAHLCLGNNFARLNMRILLEEMLARFERIELVGEPLWKPGLSVRGPLSLPIKTMA